VRSAGRAVSAVPGGGHGK